MSPRLSDFGHVRQKSGASCSSTGQTRLHTKSRYMVTSAAYMDSSLYHDSSKVDPKVDVYSMGVVMLEMLTDSKASNFESLEQEDLIMKMSLPLYNAEKEPEQLLKFISSFNDASKDCRIKFSVIIRQCLDDRRKRLTSSQLVKELRLLNGMHFAMEIPA